MAAPRNQYDAVIDMNRFTPFPFVLLVAILGTTGRARAQATQALSSPLSLADVIRIAGDRRDEIQAARARARAGEARPAIVSALEDPMVAPSLDHLPFMLGGADFSVTI
jgi:hypothetical protein